MTILTPINVYPVLVLFTVALRLFLARNNAVDHSSLGLNEFLDSFNHIYKYQPFDWFFGINGLYFGLRSDVLLLPEFGEQMLCLNHHLSIIPQVFNLRIQLLNVHISFCDCFGYPLVFAPQVCELSIELLYLSFKVLVLLPQLVLLSPALLKLQSDFIIFALPSQKFVLQLLVFHFNQHLFDPFDYLNLIDDARLTEFHLLEQKIILPSDFFLGLCIFLVLQLQSQHCILELKDLATQPIDFPCVGITLLLELHLESCSNPFIELARVDIFRWLWRRGFLVALALQLEAQSLSAGSHLCGCYIISKAECNCQFASYYPFQNSMESRNCTILRFNLHNQHGISANQVRYCCQLSKISIDDWVSNICFCATEEISGHTIWNGASREVAQTDQQLIDNQLNRAVNSIILS